MNQLISHIEFLLHDHNCVIVPDFGGFVVNTIPPRRDGIAAFDAPACELVFNRDLSHNDGLLAQSYMKNGNMAFELAMQKVEQDVQLLKRQLREQRRVEMGKLGSFDMHDDKRFVYTPGDFVRPALFGLTQAALKPLIQIQPVVPNVKSENRHRWNRRLGITAAAVAAIAVLMVILPVSDSIIPRQSAQMISEAEWFRSKAVQPVSSDSKDVIGEISIETDRVIEADEAEESSAVLDEIVAPIADAAEEALVDNSPKYYVVMGVFSGKVAAEKTTRLLLDEGFHQTGWLRRSGRIDVYAAAFTDKNAAEVYLKEVHKKFPMHSDAWILKK